MHSFRAVISVKVNAGIAWISTILRAWHHVQDSSHVSITAEASVGNHADHAKRVALIHVHTRYVSTNVVIDAPLVTKTARGPVTTTNATESVEMYVTESHAVSLVHYFSFAATDVWDFAVSPVHKFAMFAMAFGCNKH